MRNKPVVGTAKKGAGERLTSPVPIRRFEKKAQPVVNRIFDIWMTATLWIAPPLLTIAIIIHIVKGCQS